MQGSTRIDELRQKFHENPRRYFAPLANEYRKAGDPEQAIAICRAHLAQQPGHMSGHVVYGQALYDAKRPEEARAVFEKALALDPDNAIVLKQLGDIAREKGDTHEARHWYSRALETDPNDRETAAYIAELTEPVTEAAQVEEPAVAEREVPAPEPSREPEVAAVSDEALEPSVAIDETPPVPAEEPPPSKAEENVTWRKTPPHEESPFVTRTMAELYASQGYRQAALDVYRQLALQHPDDKEIFDRIDALEKHAEPAADVPPADDGPAPEPIAFEPMISDLPVESEAETLTEVTRESIFAPSSEDLNLDVPATPVSRPEPHFTETELATGDTWDTDTWAAGFGPDEDLNLEFDSPDIPAAETSEATEPVKEEPVIEQPEVEKAAVEEAAVEEPVAEEPALAEHIGAEPTAQSEIILTEPAAEDLAEEPVEETVEEPVEQPAYETAPEPAPPAHETLYEAEPEPEDASHVVAYSPQLPEEEDLPHYAPKGPTVREFFAALGAFRPSARAGSSITAHAGIPAPQEEPAADEYPLANDAFATMFSDSPVSEEDSRAAFALSGALGASEPTSAALTAPHEPQPPSEPASPAPTQESEEDIRRFREWLDGLADT